MTELGFHGDGTSGWTLSSIAAAKRRPGPLFFSSSYRQQLLMPLGVKLYRRILESSRNPVAKLLTRGGLSGSL
jgi:hypothetical protein